MKRNFTGVPTPSWTKSPDLALAARLCEKWNSSKLYEIFWEYARLNANVLTERRGEFWLCHEGSKLTGFALARSVRGCFVVEELWGQFDGVFGDVIKMSKRDLVRARAFGSQVLKGIAERPLLIRGAMDNCFAHGIARALKLPWFNGLVLADRTIGAGVGPVTIPDGYAIRAYAPGDEAFFSCLYRQVYSETVSSEKFEDWATKSKCRTYVALRGSERVGFVIAEKRPYDLLGDFTIAVSPLHQRRGVGGALLDAGLDSLYRMGARRAIADYRTLNGATHALYGSRNFKPRRTYNYFWV
jgi:ribosomal protein S18 acetylase RimI-like enzyme